MKSVVLRLVLFTLTLVIPGTIVKRPSSNTIGLGCHSVFPVQH